MIAARRVGIRQNRVAADLPGTWTSTYANNPARFTVSGQSITDTGFGVTYTVTSYGSRGVGNIVLTGGTGAGSSNPDGFGILYANGTSGGFQANTVDPRTFSMAPNAGSPGIGLVGYFGGSFDGDPTKQPSYVLP